jgi:D-3-phosphoglycerate dehydrogenase
VRKVLAAGDHFVVPQHIRRSLEPDALQFGLTVEELRLPWPVEPFGPVGEVAEASGHEDEVGDALGDAEICVSQMIPLTRRVLERAERLRLVCITRGGPVNVNLDAAREHGVQVCSSPGRNAVATAEHTVALILSALRRIPARQAELERGEWRSDFYRYDRVGPEVAGSTVGLIGYGAVGSIVARILAAMGAAVQVYDPFVSPAGLQQGMRLVPELDDLLRSSTVVSLHARLTPESAGMIGERELALLPSGSVLVNAARGPLLDEAALAVALHSGHLFGAALDVYATEPLASDSPLRGAPNLVMTPHLAGATRETADRAVAVAARQVHQYLTGAPIDHLVG